MKLTVRQRIELAKKIIWKQPLTKEESQIAPRQPYRWGAKNYLSGFRVGETREFQEDYRWDSLRSIASRMKEDFGCVFSLCVRDGKKFITRLE